MQTPRVAVLVERPSVAGPAWTALAAACHAQGWAVRWQRPSVFDGTLPLSAAESCVLVVVPGGRTGATIAAAVRDRAPTLVLENPPLRDLPAAPDDPWVGLFAGGVGTLADAARADARRSAALGITVADRAAVVGPTLLLGQVPTDAAHGGDAGAYLRWLLATAASCVTRGQSVAFRPHPLAPEVRVPGVPTWDVAEPLSAALARCGRVVTYSSSAQFTAARFGVPVEAMEPAGWTLAERLHAAAWATWRVSELATLDLVALATGQLDAIPVDGANADVRALPLTPGRVRRARKVA